MFYCRCILPSLLASAMNVQVPDGLGDLLREFTIACLHNQPQNIFDFAAEWFAKQRDAQRNRQVPMYVSSTTGPPTHSHTYSTHQGRSYYILLLFTKLETVIIMTSCKFSTSVISYKQKQILLFHYRVIAYTSCVLNSLTFTIKKSTFVEDTSFQ